jgi:hypothetical protein
MRRRGAARTRFTDVARLEQSEGFAPLLQEKSFNALIDKLRSK